MKKNVTDNETKKNIKAKKATSKVGDKTSKKSVDKKKEAIKNEEKHSCREDGKKSEVTVGNASFKRVDLKKYLTKVNITYFILAILDVILVIYMARQNVVNYVVILDEEIFVSKTKYLLYGRNYINLIITAFFYIYTCLVTKFFLKRKITKKFLLWLFVVLTVINILLFFIFTEKVY